MRQHDGGLLCGQEVSAYCAKLNPSYKQNALRAEKDAQGENRFRGTTCIRLRALNFASLISPLLRADRVVDYPFRPSKQRNFPDKAPK